MAYVSLYRKYRPQTFEDVVGQEHVTRTLRNAITEGRVASGYLFCGTRGTAKTTCARILAKALNCIGPDGQRQEPSPEPCGMCEPCKSIAASAFVDVLEMDAASHGKVDDVRDLVASIKFPPMEGRFKVYIIDEAHQLSRDAMDAFLKTLEEPPERVVFILATTEQDKLPITISSRCQVFEFKRGSVAQIAARLTAVLKQEGVKTEPAAVTLVARAADGSYRDSLSLLEQVLAYKRQNLTARDVGLVLGAVDEDVLNRVVDLVASSDAAGAFALAGDLLESGRDVRQFLKSLSGRLRDLLFVGVGAQSQGAGEIDDPAMLSAQAARFSPAALLHALEVLTEAEQEMRRNNQHRLLLEMTLLRLMHLPQTGQVPSVSVVSPAPAPAQAAAPPEPAQNTPEDPPAETEHTVPVQTPSAPTGLNGSHPEEVAAPETESALFDEAPLITPPIFDDAESDLVEDESPFDLLDAPVPGDDVLDLLVPDEDLPPSLLVTSEEEHTQTEDFLQVQQVTGGAPAIAEAPPAPLPPVDAPEELVHLQKSWQEVINRMGSRAPSGVALVKDAKPIALHGTSFTLQFTSRFYIDRMEGNERGRKTVEDIINKTLDAAPGTYKIKCVLQGEDAKNGKGNGAAPGARVRQASAVPADNPDSPLLDEVIAVFGGRVVDEGDTKG